MFCFSVYACKGMESASRGVCIEKGGGSVFARIYGHSGGDGLHQIVGGSLFTSL